MSKHLFFLLTFLIAGNLFAQNKVLSKIPVKGNVINDFIPEGYDTLATTKGDLNKDNIEDYVLVLKSTEEDKENPPETPQRILLVLLQSSGGLALAAKSDSAILCKDCGGIFGDPFEGISITKGVLSVSHYGGSAWRWGSTYKFRYQQNDFYLIGETTHSYWNVSMCEKLNEFAATHYKDVNLLTGAYVEKKVSEEGCKLLINKKGKQKVQPLKKLNVFNIEN